MVTPLQRGQIRRRRNKDGTFRFYADYVVPDTLGGGAIRNEPLHITAQDRTSGFNRTEHLRGIPPGDEDYDRLYPRRSDAESIHRYLDDTMFLSRAHSNGADRQFVDLLGFAIVVNALSAHRARAKVTTWTASRLIRASDLK